MKFVAQYLTKNQWELEPTGHFRIVDADTAESAAEIFSNIRKDSQSKWIGVERSGLVGMMSPRQVFENKHYVEAKEETAAQTKQATGLDIDILNSQLGAQDLTTAHSKKKQYKVMTQKDKWFTQKFDPERLEQALNAYASEGWTVKSICTASIRGFGSNREELIVVFEK